MLLLQFFFFCCFNCAFSILLFFSFIPFSLMCSDKLRGNEWKKENQYTAQIHWREKKNCTHSSHLYQTVKQLRIVKFSKSFFSMLFFKTNFCSVCRLSLHCNTTIDFNLLSFNFIHHWLSIVHVITVILKLFRSDIWDLGSWEHQPIEIQWVHLPENRYWLCNFWI